MFNQGSPTQQASIYAEFGMDPQRVMDAMMERRKNRDPNQRMRGETNIFRVLIKTLLSVHIITERTMGFYSAFVDMDELRAEGDVMPGEAIAEDGIRYLQGINFKERAERGAASLVAAE
jgi:hypothetical protein